MSVYCNSFFLRRFSLILYTGLFSSLIKVLSVFGHNFFTLKFHCFMFLLNFITSKYSFFRRLIQVWCHCCGTSISRFTKFFISFLVNISSCTAWSGFTCSYATRDSGQYQLVSEKFLLFYFHFFSISNNKEHQLNQSVNVFQGKTQTVQFTNIYIYIYITYITYIYIYISYFYMIYL